MGLRSGRWLVLTLLLATTLVALSPSPAAAAGTVGDGTPESCTESELEDALNDGGLVTFDCGPDPITITLTSEKEIETDTQIDGGGLVTLSGGGFRHFVVNSGVTLELHNITLRDGGGRVSDSLGGAIYSEGGTIIVNNSELTQNGVLAADFAAGGAIYVADGVIEITNSTLSANSSVALGSSEVSNPTSFGGAVLASNSIVSIDSSTFSDNASSAPTTSLEGAADGGAIFALGTTLTIVNSTFSGNGAGSTGGAIAHVGVDAGDLTEISFSTFSDNTAELGSALYSNGTGTVTVANSILTTSDGSSCSMGITSLGRNISSDGSCNLDPNLGDLPNTDAMLASLGDYGGPTQTHLPQPGSPAIDNASSTTCPDFDQRGVARPDGAGCDIGSVEAASSAPDVVAQVCVDRVTGTTRIRDGGCFPTETAVDVFAPVGTFTVCVNRATSELRVKTSGDCSRHDIQFNLPEDGPITVCIHHVTGQLRLGATGTCTRYEEAGILAGA